MRKNLLLAVTMLLVACVEPLIEPEEMTPNFALSSSEWDDVEDFLEAAIIDYDRARDHLVDADTEFSDYDASIGVELGAAATNMGYAFDDLEDAELDAQNENLNGVRDHLEDMFDRFVYLWLVNVYDGIGHCYDGFSCGGTWYDNNEVADHLTYLFPGEHSSAEVASDAAKADAYAAADNIAGENWSTAAISVGKVRDHMDKSPSTSPLWSVYGSVGSARQVLRDDNEADDTPYATLGDLYSMRLDHLRAMNHIIDALELIEEGENGGGCGLPMC